MGMLRNCKRLTDSIIDSGQSEQLAILPEMPLPSGLQFARPTSRVFFVRSKAAPMQSIPSVWRHCFLAALLLMTAVRVHAGVLQGKVVGVTDGDTITVLDQSNRQFKIRFAGIDAPEKAQPFGQRAKEHLSSLVFSKVVTVETEKEDRYGRTVGKVLLDGRDINMAMVVAGLAWHYKKYQAEQSPDDRLLYDSAEVEARAAKRGLWADSNPILPSEWRSGSRR